MLTYLEPLNPSRWLIASLIQWMRPEVRAAVRVVRSVSPSPSLSGSDHSVWMIDTPRLTHSFYLQPEEWAQYSVDLTLTTGVCWSFSSVWSLWSLNVSQPSLPMVVSTFRDGRCMFADWRSCCWLRRCVWQLIYKDLHQSPALSHTTRQLRSNLAWNLSYVLLAAEEEACSPSSHQAQPKTCIVNANHIITLLTELNWFLLTFGPTAGLQRTAAHTLIIPPTQEIRFDELK